MEDTPDIQGLVCPVPLPHDQVITLGHGSGGKLMHDLIRRHFVPHFSNPILAAGDDAGKLAFQPTGPGTLQLSISTDAHVVWPLIFPGGDIGRLAVCGTVNDVAMLGAQPRYLTASFILEEGLEISLLERILASMQAAAEEAGVEIVAGDTKVVQRGKADGLYISTTGIGLVASRQEISGARAQPGDAVLLSGPIGDHGIAVLEARGELGFEAGVQSDVAPLNQMIAALLASGVEVHVLRDPTRGGLATTLNEIAGQSQVGIHLEETRIPVRPAVQAACELLGFDPLYVANEGKLVALVAGADADKALAVLRAAPYGAGAVQIGRVSPQPAGRVLLRTSLGTNRVVDVLSGEMLPRIC